MMLLEPLQEIVVGVLVPYDDDDVMTDFSNIMLSS